MNGTTEFRCVALLAFLALILVPGGLNAESGDPGKGDNVEKNSFGKLPDGSEVEQYTLRNARGARAKLITYGATLTELWMPDKSGKNADVVLGFDNLASYAGDHPYFGAIVGRYANRIAKGKFTLDGKDYSVPINNPPNSLHGGPHGFNNVVWKGKEIPNGVELTYLSKDGEAGYPANLTTTVRYTLEHSALKIEYSATTDKDTIVNLTNHSYFNLAGQGHGDILNHQLTLHASRFTPVDSTLIPTGELRSVASTPFDFQNSTRVGDRIDSDDEQIRFGKGYDHNWVLDSAGGKLTEAAEVYEPTTGRVLRVSTTQPGIQFYTGNFLDGKL